MTTILGRQVLPFAANKKTYFMAALMVAIGVLQGFGIHVPDWAMWLIGGGSLAAHRAAIAQIANDVIDTRNTLNTVVATVSEPSKS